MKIKIFILTVLSLFFVVNEVFSQSTTANNVYNASSFLGWGATSGDLYFKVNNAIQMTLQNTTGYLGLGTTSPTCKLHIAGTDYNTSHILVQRNWGGGGWGGSLDLLALSSGMNYMTSSRILGYVNFRGEYNGDANTALGASFLATTTETWSTTGHGSELNFKTTENGSTTCTERMVIANNGYVGIGVTNPGAKLDVRGNAIFNEDGGDNDFRIEGDNNANLFFVDAGNDRVGIGTQSPTSRLFIQGSGNTSTTSPLIVKNSDGNLILHLKDDRRVGVYSECPNSYRFSVDGDSYLKGQVLITDNTGICGGPFSQYELYVNGDIAYTGSIYDVSDKRYKKNIKTINNALLKVEKIRGVTFNFRINEFKKLNFPKGMQYGFIAQEIKEVVPDLVSKDDNGYYSVNYVKMVPILTEAIKEQQKIIKNQNTKITNIENELALLKETIALLKEENDATNDKAELIKKQ